MLGKNKKQKQLAVKIKVVHLSTHPNQEPWLYHLIFLRHRARSFSLCMIRRRKSVNFTELYTFILALMTLTVLFQGH